MQLLTKTFIHHIGLSLVLLFSLTYCFLVILQSNSLESNWKKGKIENKQWPKKVCSFLSWYPYKTCDKYINNLTNLLRYYSFTQEILKINKIVFMLVELFFFFIEEIVFWPLFLFWLLSFTLSSLIRWKHLHFLRSRVFIQFHSKHEKKLFFLIINLRFLKWIKSIG